MRIRDLIPVLVLALAACETVPTSLDSATYSEITSGIEANPSAVSADAALSDLLARADLTEDQRADALFTRASRRLDAKFDLPGAIEDFDSFLIVQTEDPRSASAARHKVFAASEIENAQRRLARLQNLPDWFDDQILMGELSKAADRYREAQLTPTEAQLYLLREAGFICASANGETGAEPSKEDAVHQHGAAPEYMSGEVWCRDPSLS